MFSVLIAGCGYLGNRIGQRLGSHNYDVHTITRKKAKESMAWYNYRLDFKKKHTLKILPKNIDFIIYTVAPANSTPQAYRDCYQVYLENLADYYANTNIKNTFIATSTRVYAENSGGWVDETSTNLNDDDEQARYLIAAENNDFFKQTTSLRLSGIYGKGRTQFLQSVIKGNAITPEGAAKFSNRIHVQDAARAVHFLIKNNIFPEKINVSDDCPENRSVVIEWLAAQLQVQKDFTTEPIESDIGKRVQNRMLKDLGFRFHFPSYKEGYLPHIKAGNYE